MKANVLFGVALAAVAAGVSAQCENGDIARLERLIRIPSVSSNIVEVNRAVDCLAGELAGEGMWCRIETMKDGRKVLFAANVATNRPDVVLSSHIDVVPALDPSQFVPRREGGRIYGRGASDCKEHVVLCARLMRELKGKVSMGTIFGSDEEIGGMSTAFMIDRGYGATRLAIVLDSEQFAITTLQKGLARYRFTADAPATHAGMAKGPPPSAVRTLMRGFEAAAEALPDFEDGSWRDLMLLDRISGTRKHAELEVTLRCTKYGEWERLESLLREKFKCEFECLRKGDPVILDETQPYLVEFLGRMRRKWPGRKVDFYHLNSSTDARHLQRLNLPMLILGVDARGAHTAAEYVEVASLDEYADLIGSYLAEKFAMGGDCAMPALIPMPREVKWKEGWFAAAENPDRVQVKSVADASIPDEGYRLSVAADGITVRSGGEAGAFYARQTLRQLAERAGKGWKYRCVEISDAPAFRWRGVLLDEGRHFFGKETVRKLLDLMAMYKYNVFHWHLTEDQGWRIDVPKYPKLAQMASMRLRSPAHGSTLGRGKDADGARTYTSSEMTTQKYGPFFYTADDIREIVAYAAERHISVVPEIELPGHARAALGAYPELSCFPERIPAGSAAEDWGIFRDVFCMGNDETIRFLEDVMDYVCELFPSPVIHIGGDECPTINWSKCPKCQERMRKEGLTKPAELQIWITKHMARYLAKKGRRIMGWDEILNGDVPKTAIGQSWRVAAKEGAGTDHVSGAQGAVKGHEMVMSPHNLTYYSAQQGLEEDPFRRAPKGGLSLEKAYTFDPLAGVPEEARGKVIGGQCCMWGEYLWNEYDLAWRMWPRAFAMSEILWSAPAKRDFEEFQRRAAAERKRLISMGVNCAPLK